MSPLWRCTVDVTASGADCGDGVDGTESTGENKSGQLATVRTLFFYRRSLQLYLCSVDVRVVSEFGRFDGRQSGAS